jgi:iron complex transport system ATP-binding protein
MSLLEIKNLAFRYPALSSFELYPTGLTIDKGELVGLLGPNGAGKSTLLKLMAGLLIPRIGEILLEDHPLKNLPARDRARKIAYVPQSLHFTFPLGVREVVEMGRYPHLRRFEPLGKKDREICDRALDLCNALNFKDRLYEELSGGEKQRVLLASALAQTPEVLLLDEPTLSLDLPHQIRLFEIIQNLHQEESLTVVVATHELNLAGRYLNRLVLMKEGKKMMDGPSTLVLTPKTIQALHGVKVITVRIPGSRPYFVPAQAGKKRKTAVP